MFNKILFLLFTINFPALSQAVVLQPNTTSGIIYNMANQTASRTSMMQINSAVPSVDVTTTQTNGTTALQNHNESDIAVGLIKNIAEPILTVSAPTAPATLKQACVSYFPSNGLTKGLPLYGKVYACRHAYGTGYGANVLSAAITSYTVPAISASGDDIVPADGYSDPNNTYTSYNDMVDNLSQSGSSLGVFGSPASGVVQGIGASYVASRFLPLMLKEFDYMVTKMPNYLTTWQAESQTAQASFQTELNTMLSSLGVQASTPLSSTFSTDITTALQSQQTSFNSNTTAATAATAAAAAATKTSNAAKGATTSSASSLSVPAAQQPLLDAVITATSNAATQLATYNTANANYVTQQGIYTTNYNKYTAEKAKKPSPSYYSISKKDRDFAAGYYCMYCINVPAAGNYSVTTYQRSLTGFDYRYNSVRTKIVTSYIITKYPSGLPAGYNTTFNGTNLGFNYMKYNITHSAIIPTTHHPATSGSNPTLLAQYKAAYTNASALMAQYKNDAAVALAASKASTSTAKSKLTALKTALLNNVTSNQTAAANYTAAAATNATNATNGASSAINLAYLDSLLNNMGQLISMAQGVTNNLVNTVTLATLKQSAKVIRDAYFASLGRGTSLPMGDGVASDQEVASATGVGTATTPTALSFLSTPVAPKKLNGLRDTPYRSLVKLESAMTDMRTAISMIAVATKGAGMTLSNALPKPKVEAIKIANTNQFSSINIKALGDKVHNVISSL